MQPSKRMFKVIAMLLAMLLVWQAPIALANTLSDLKEEQKKNKDTADKLNSSIKDKSSEIKTIENEQTSLLDQISDLSVKIEKTNKDIEKLNKDIAKANDEITALEKEMAILQKKIDERTQLLEERARAIQVSGNVSYLDVLLGANSFVDFIDRFSAVSTLIDADRKIMREQKEDKLKLEDQKIVLENTKKQLEESQAKLESLKTSLDVQKNDKRKLVNQLEAEQSKLESEKKLLEEEYSEYLSINKELEKKIEAEQARLAEIARQEALKNKGNSGNGNTPAIASGTWTKPANGRFTSGFGWRNIGAGNEFHHGIDIANSVGTPIVASNGGVVSYASALSSYGNVIMITHIVDGAVWTTVYAHLSSIQVSVGQSVSKGQQIGLMGNTGRSTGSHLHFEIHNGAWKSGRPNALNPLQYINL
jgi:murein DD-endopeptidase MepM/ murein hydrolase activator NlpD